MQATVLLIVLAASAITASSIACREHGYRVVAILLGWTLASGVARDELQAIILRPARAALGDAPYVWPERLAFHVDTALLLSWPFAVLASAIVLFLRRSAWPAGAAWVATSIAYAAAYPWLRLELLDTASALAWSVALAGTVAAMTVSWCQRDQWSAEHWIVGLTWAIGFTIAAVVLWWACPTENWEIARRIQKVGYGGLLSYQVWRLVRS